MTRDERGAATAELALGIPLLVSLTVGLVWLLAVGEAQVRIVDAARETARAAARGDASAEAVARGRQVAPGAVLTVAERDGEVVSTASDSVAAPGGLLAFLPAAHVHAEAVAATEGSP
jgi:Flp pilus assembly protein TadG